MASMVIPQVPVVKFVFLSIWDGCLRELPELPNVRQATCLVWWGMGDCYRSNIGESSVISSWFGIHWTMSHSFVEISVILDLWWCSWGLSAVPSCKSRLLTCLIANLELLYTQFRGIGPRLSPRGEVSWFFSCCSGNLGYIIELWQGWPFKTRVC